jgi:nucleotide-binding universal stress UspA family protein
VTVVVGYAPEGRARAVLHLAGMLSRSGAGGVVLCAVVPFAWPPGPGRVDAEYRTHLDRVANEALAQARERLPGAETVLRHARSVPTGLLEVAAERSATVLVVGDTAGSVVSRLLHSAPLPVAMAPHGFRCRPDARVSRITVAFGGAAEVAVAAADVAARLRAPLRLASFAVRPRAPYTVAVGREADDAMLAEWIDGIGAAAQAALGEIGRREAVPPALDAVVGRGESWQEALEDVEWEEGDVLVVGSSSGGPLARVFLGSRSAKIVRHAPVPVVVVPRP